LGADQRTASVVIYNVLVQVCKGCALGIIRSVEHSADFEA